VPYRTLGAACSDAPRCSVQSAKEPRSGPTAGSETTDALEFLARLTSHIPNKGQVLRRYYGWYASRVRGMRRKAAEAGDEHPIACVDPEPEVLSEAGKRWAELLRPHLRAASSRSIR
jgi:hypothetical protein